MLAAAPAITPKPSTAAISATTKKITIHFNIRNLFLEIQLKLINKNNI